jgi:hypothetical protein
MTVKEIAGLRNRVNGQAFEIRVHKKAKRGSWASARSSGSFGKVDVWSIKNGKLCLNLCKRNGYLTQNERRRYAEWFREAPKVLTIQVEFSYYKSPKKWTSKIIKNSDDFYAFNSPTIEK